MSNLRVPIMSIPRKPTTTAPPFAVPLDAADPWINRKLDKYLLTHKIGQGGMGVVYAAQDVVLKRKVAVKLLPEWLRDDADALEALVREARAVARLNHPNVVCLYDAQARDQLCYLVMELMPGGSVQRLLQTRGPMPKVFTKSLPVPNGKAKNW